MGIGFGTVLGDIFGGMGGLTAGLEAGDTHRLAQQKLLLEQQRLASENAARMTDLAMAGKAIGLNLGQGMVPTAAFDTLVKVAREKQTEEELRQRQTQAADILESRYPEQPGLSPSGAPLGRVGEPESTAAAAAILRQGLIKEPGTLFEKILEFQDRRQRQADMLAGLGRLAGIDLGQGGAPTRSAVSPEGLPPAPGGIGGAIPGTGELAPGAGVLAPAAAPDVGPTAARPAMPRYRAQQITIDKEGNASISLQPPKIINDYQAAAFFGSQGRADGSYATDMSELKTDAERQRAEQYLREFQVRNPDMLVSSYLLSGDPSKVNVANKFLDVQAERERRVAQATTEARTAATPLSEADKAAIDTHTAVLTALEQLTGNYDPKEIGFYTGMLNRPIAEVMQRAAGIGLTDVDARYSQYKLLMGRLKETAFASGGKNLTPFEGSVVWSYTPTGEEPNAEQIVQKVRYLEAFTKAARSLRLQLARTGRSNLDEEQFNNLLRDKMKEVGIPIPQKKPGWVVPPAGAPGGGGAPVVPGTPAPTAPGTAPGQRSQYTPEQLAVLGNPQKLGETLSSMRPVPQGKKRIILRNGVIGDWPEGQPLPDGAYPVSP